MSESKRVERGVRIGLRWQVILALVGVGLLIAFFGVYQTYEAHREASRGAFLNKHYNRFEACRMGLGQGMAANAALIAEAFPLAKSLREETAGPIGARIAEALQRTMEPELIIIVDNEGEPVRADGLTPISTAEAQRSRVLADLRGGMTIAGEIAVFDGKVYQVSGVPIRGEYQIGPDGEREGDRQIVGGVLIGEDLTTYLNDYRRQSDPNEVKQHRLTLVAADGEVLASVFPEDQFGELATNLQEDSWSQAQEGDGKVDIIGHAGHIYDFHRADVRGYRDNDYGDLGWMFLMRTRDHKAEDFQERVESSVLTLIAVVILTLVLGAGLAWLITRRINRYVEATADLAAGHGDLTRRLTVGRRDELGRLAENLNSVFAHIHSLAGKVQHAAFQVGASSAEISAASRQMLDGAQEQAAKTESSTAAITELSASIQQVAENATEASRVARSSGEAVRKAIERMNEIRQTVDEAAARIHDLGESGKRIGNIVEVIRQISDQTTLLALNAAIEAAHAGEQGRGFAVVADEVSGLANRVGQSARDIEDLIATITEQTVEAVRAMEAGTMEVDAGTRLVTETLGDLTTLVKVVEDTAAAVQEQAVASDEIARNMDVVQRIAQEVLSSSEEAVEQGEHLHRLAHGLEESVKGFQTEGNKLSEPPGAEPKQLKSDN